jgi:DNA-binding CsgD family transcriptional regulator
MPSFPLNPALGLLAAIYRLQDIDSLCATILTELPRIIPCDNAMIAHHDGNRRALRNLALQQPFARADFLTNTSDAACFARHPFWSCPSSSSKLLSELAPGRRWLALPLYRDLLREDRFRDQLAIEFGPSVADQLSVSLIRSTVGFRPAEKETLLLLLPHLEQAFANARLIDPSLTTTNHTTAIPISHHGAWPDHACREKILSLLATANHRAAFDQWLSLAIGQLNRGTSSLPPLVIRHRSLTSTIHLRRDWISGQYRILHRHSSDTCSLHAKPLSKKEHEILFWIAEGKSNPEIAAILAISLETVKTHLKKIFRKLGVESRTAAANHARQFATSPPET